MDLEFSELNREFWFGLLMFTFRKNENMVKIALWILDSGN